ncbi:MAG: hypothetical protein WCG47_03785 [Dermatophilaceae bacterium]
MSTPAAESVVCSCLPVNAMYSPLRHGPARGSTAERVVRLASPAQQRQIRTQIHSPTYM